jgi:hypothetical protein
MATGNEIHSQKLTVKENLLVGTKTGNEPDPCAIAEYVSTTKGVLFPRMTSTQRDAISTPTEGLLIYNTTDSVNQVYNGGTWQNLVAAPNEAGAITTILADQVVGSVGSASQLQAGHIWGTDEGGTGTDLAYYKFLTGALTTDNETTYDLSNVNTVAEADGIMGAKSAVEFNGSNNYFTQATLLDTTPTAIAIDFWFKADDGQPASSQALCAKVNDETGGSIDTLFLYLSTSGSVYVSTNAAGANKDIQSSTLFANGAMSTWNYVVFNWDATNGIRLWINGVLEASNSTATTLMSSGTTRDFIIGAYNYGGSVATYYDGKMSLFRVRDQVLTQKDVDKGYSTYVAISPSASSTDFQLWAIQKEANSSSYVSQTIPREVHRTTSGVHLYGAQFNAADSISIKIRE